MWFKFEYEDYCGGSTYYESVDPGCQPIIRGFRIERLRFLQPGSHTQKMTKKHVKQVKIIEGKEWTSYDEVIALNPLPESHKQWINPVSTVLDDGSVYHQFLFESEDWFMEINTIEEFIDLGGAALNKSMEGTPYEINEIRISYKPDIIPYVRPENTVLGKIGYILEDQKSAETV